MVDPRPNAVRVLVVDDHDLVRASLLRVLADQTDLRPVGAASTLGEARDLIERTHPDIVLLDHVLPDGRGADAVPDLIALQPTIRVVMLTATVSDAVLCKAVQGGAAGFVCKTHGHEAILGAVRAAVRGDAAISHALMRRLLSRAGGSSEHHAGHLSETDRELLALLYAEIGIGGVAERLDTGFDVVHRQVASISERLGGRSTLESLLIAVRAGLIAPPS